MPGLDTGVLAFQVLAARLKETGATGLRRELGNAINDAAKPALEDVRRGLPDHMPDRYAEVLDNDLQLTITKRAVSSPGVRITARNRGLGGVQRRRLNRLEGGVLAHPLFGNRRHWFDQTDGVTAGFFSGPLQDAQPQVRDAIIAAMIRIADKLTRKV